MQIQFPLHVDLWISADSCRLSIHYHTKYQIKRDSWPYNLPNRNYSGELQAKQFYLSGCIKARNENRIKSNLNWYWSKQSYVERSTISILFLFSCCEQKLVNVADLLRKKRGYL